MNHVPKKPLQTNLRSYNPPSIEDSFIRFSFKFFCCSKAKFSLDQNDRQYFKTLIERLKDISGLTSLEFRTNKSKSLRAHKIDWKRTSEPEGFRHLNTQLKDCEPWQFQLSANAHGRVHGFLVHETFYVVWLDPEHKLYS